MWHRLRRRYWQLGGTAAQFVIIVISSQFEATLAWQVAMPLLVLLSLLSWLLAMRHVRAVIDMPTSKVASAAQGYVELEGVGRPFAGAPLLAHLSVTPCLWYRYRVEVRRGEQWHTESSGVSDASFLLDDESGVCVVDPEGAEIMARFHRTWREGDRRYSEWRIDEGDPVYALGHFVTRAATDGLDVNEDVKNLLTEWKGNPQRLVVRFDLDGDGRVSLDEWEHARTEARREVIARHREMGRAGDTHLMHAPADGRMYLIASIGPEAIARRYRLWAAFHLACFFGALVGAGVLWRID